MPAPWVTCSSEPLCIHLYTLWSCVHTEGQMHGSFSNASEAWRALPRTKAWACIHTKELVQQPVSYALPAAYVGGSFFIDRRLDLRWGRLPTCSCFPGTDKSSCESLAWLPESCLYRGQTHPPSCYQLQGETKAQRNAKGSTPYCIQRKIVCSFFTCVHTQNTWSCLLLNHKESQAIYVLINK